MSNFLLNKKLANFLTEMKTHKSFQNLKFLFSTFYLFNNENNDFGSAKMVVHILMELLEAKNSLKHQEETPKIQIIDLTFVWNCIANAKMDQIKKVPIFIWQTNQQFS